MRLDHDPPAIAEFKPSDCSDARLIEQGSCNADGKLFTAKLVDRAIHRAGRD
jgi:hypothetical protein